MDPRAYTLHADLETKHWWFAGRRAIVQNVARGLSLPPDARILELGSGTGGNLGFLGAFGSVSAVEIDDGARAVARERAPHAEHLRAMSELTGHAFDAAFMLDVLEHLDEPVEVLRELLGWMAPGAPLVLTVPAQSWLYGAHDRFHHHRRRYDEPELRTHLELAGFTIDAIAPMNTLLFPAAVVARGVEALTPWRHRSEGQARGLTMPQPP